MRIYIFLNPTCFPTIPNFLPYLSINFALHFDNSALHFDNSATFSSVISAIFPPSFPRFSLRHSRAFLRHSRAGGNPVHNSVKNIQSFFQEGARRNKNIYVFYFFKKGFYFWIPAFAGMTEKSAGMTEGSAGMTKRGAVAELTKKLAEKTKRADRDDGNNRQKQE